MVRFMGSFPLSLSRYQKRSNDRTTEPSRELLKLTKEGPTGKQCVAVDLSLFRCALTLAEHRSFAPATQEFHHRFTDASFWSPIRK